ncbi:MAG TPA: hypothetical protein VGX16_04860, partial [Solirubrobacteraceae bacterium]|nr:hypothetical protein [Solirubrobacteraceae bacterium]
MPRLRVLLCALLACSSLTAAVGAGRALASHGQTVYFEAGSDLLNPSRREGAIEQMRRLGVGALRVELYWFNVAPGARSATRPSFDARDPS